MTIISKGSILMRKTTLISSTAIAAALLSSALVAGPASAATVVGSPSASAASASTVQHDFTVTLVIESASSFSLAGDGEPSAAIHLLDATGAVVEQTVVGSDGTWSLPGGALDGFGGSITVQQVRAGTTTAHTIDLTSIPPAP